MIADLWLALWVAVYVLAGVAVLGLVILAVVGALIVRDTRRIEREHIEREGRPLSAAERSALDEMEHGEGGS